MPFNQIATSVSIFSSGLIGYNAVSLSFSITDPSIAPKIATGSAIEIAGAFFSASEDIVINASSWSAISNGTDAYILLTPTGTPGSQTLTASYTTIHPVWSTSKQGWYASAGSVVRCIGGLRKTVSGYSYPSIFYNTGFEQGTTKNALNTNYGFSSLYRNTVGYDNCAFGNGALYNNTDGVYNCAFGNGSLAYNSTGFDNSAFGWKALYANTTGIHNSAFGVSALANNTTGGYNSAFGVSALASNTIGLYNCAFGKDALAYNSSGESNCAMGNGALYLNTTGANNCAIGSGALRSNAIGINNCAFGSNSLFYNTASNNTAYGINSLQANTTGVNNCAFGVLSLNANTTGTSNSAFGYNALFSNVKGTTNCAFGSDALRLSTSNANTAVGHGSGNNITTGFNDTCIGSSAQASSATISNEITLGNSFVTTLRCNVTSITALSDKRDKKNIEDLSLGLDFVKKLKPSSWNFDRRDWYENGIADGSKISDKKSYGFIAQDFQAIQKEYGVDLGLVMESNPDKLEATPGNLLPVLIKAIQELSMKVEALENK